MENGNSSTFHRLILASHQYRESSDWMDGSVEKKLLSQVKYNEIAWIICEVPFDKVIMTIEPNSRVIICVWKFSFFQKIHNSSIYVGKFVFIPHWTPHIFSTFG